ncbi:hypothetical protein FS842_010389 [Serendipita sp. 407]|nr:hypothetical protein FS842_010389 [Serendipita sp. 407]
MSGMVVDEYPSMTPPPPFPSNATAGDGAAAIILSGSRTGNTNGAGAIGFSVVVQTVLSMAVVLGLVSGLF